MGDALSSAEQQRRKPSSSTIATAEVVQRHRNGTPISSKLAKRTSKVCHRKTKDEDSDSSESEEEDYKVAINKGGRISGLSPELHWAQEANHAKAALSCKERRQRKSSKAYRLGSMKLNRELEKRLKKFWEFRAEEKGTAMYHLCGDNEIMALAAHVPETIEQLKQLDKWGTTKIKKHGQAVIDVIQIFLKEKSVALKNAFQPERGGANLQVDAGMPGSLGGVQGDCDMDGGSADGFEFDEDFESEFHKDAGFEGDFDDD